MSTECSYTLALIEVILAANCLVAVLPIIIYEIWVYHIVKQEYKPAKCVAQWCGLFLCLSLAGYFTNIWLITYNDEHMIFLGYVKRITCDLGVCLTVICYGMEASYIISDENDDDRTCYRKCTVSLVQLSGIIVLVAYLICCLFYFVLEPTEDNDSTGFVIWGVILAAACVLDMFYIIKSSDTLLNLLQYQERAREQSRASNLSRLSSMTYDDDLMTITFKNDHEQTIDSNKLLQDSTNPSEVLPNLTSNPTDDTNTHVSTRNQDQSTRLVLQGQTDSVITTRTHDSLYHRMVFLYYTSCMFALACALLFLYQSYLIYIGSSSWIDGTACPGPIDFSLCVGKVTVLLISSWLAWPRS